VKELYVDIKNLQDRLEDNFADILLKLTNKYIELYSENINRQVRRSYLVLFFFAISGGIVILAGAIGALFFNLRENSYAVMVSGAITGFITAILFKLHNDSISEMSRYRDKMLETQKIALALKAAEILPEDEKSKAVLAIIRFLLGTEIKD
jgi:hypothetical protein